MYNALITSDTVKKSNLDLSSDIEEFFSFFKTITPKYRSNEYRKLLPSFQNRGLKSLENLAENSQYNNFYKRWLPIANFSHNFQDMVNTLITPEYGQNE